MWNRFRRWKPEVVLLVAIPSLWLMDTARPGSTLGGYAGMGLTAALGIAYVVEEIVWIVRNQGRPCGKCGQKVQLKPFRLAPRCPECGSML